VSLKLHDIIDAVVGGNLSPPTRSGILRYKRAIGRRLHAGRHGELAAAEL